MLKGDRYLMFSVHECQFIHNLSLTGLLLINYCLLLANYISNNKTDEFFRKTSEVVWKIMEIYH